MKDLSLFLLKNSLGAKMRKGYSSFCNGDTSTSILNQQCKNDGGASGDQDSCYMTAQSLPSSDNNNIPTSASPTLEEMILQLEFEEKMAKIAADHDDDRHHHGEMRRRMSCVSNSDILRSARNALNQYPRFSLDGKDAMYRSSFQNLPPISGRKSIGHSRGGYGFDSESEKKSLSCLPAILAGEKVVWCKPGVVAKLMGLEAVPVPVRINRKREKSSSAMKKQFINNNLRKKAEKNEMERRKPIMGSCSTTAGAGYCVLKPIKVEPAAAANDGPGWPIRRRFQHS